MTPPAPDFRRVISVPQPLLALVTRPDITDPRSRRIWHRNPDAVVTIYRNHGTTYRGELYLHSMKAFDAPLYASLSATHPRQADLLRGTRPPHFTHAPLGAICGRARLLKVINSGISATPYAWILDNIEALPPEPMNGKGNLWIAGNARTAPYKERVPRRALQEHSTPERVIAPGSLSALTGQP